MTQIIGLFLVKNEDIYIEKSVRNVIDFCDQIFICDNYSCDGTWEILKRLENQHSKINLQRVTQPRESHDCVEEYAGTPTWVFAVDGDEVYDPEGLKKLREEILLGKYDRYFKLVGNSLHVDQADFEAKTAQGYLAPPAKNVTKLYNFNAVTVWRVPPYERLHGGEMVFREGYSDDSRFFFHDLHSWEESHFRCLHMCFMKRSSQESEKEVYARLIPDERQATSSFWKSLVNRLLRRDPGLEKENVSGWKLKKYAVGEKVTKSIKEFLTTNGHK